MRRDRDNLAEARRMLANHQTADRPGRCFYFRDPKMGSHYDVLPPLAEVA